MSIPVIYTTTFPSLRDTETIADAVQRMLDDRVSDLPVIDASGRLVGMFKLDRLYQTLLPKAALLGDGMADLGFVSDTLGQLREKMRAIEHRAVHEFVVAPDTGKLAGMVSARDVLLALRGEGN